MIETTENNSLLKEAIVKTIAFFDMFACALTANEIRRALPVKADLTEVIAALAEGINGIEGANGFYFLSQRREIAAERQRRYAAADKKFKRALLVARLYKFIPWIKLIAVGNLMGAHNLRPASDIDLFIVTEPNRLWLSRFFCAGLAQVLGLRPDAGGNKDKICLSFFVSEAGLNLKSLMLENKTPLTPLDKGGEDIYFIYWLANLTPIYDRGGVYEKLLAANPWLNNYLVNWRSALMSGRRDAGAGFSAFYRDVIDMFLGGLESRFKKIQIKMLPPELKKNLNRDSRVVADDKVIKLHANDRREEYLRKYLTSLRPASRNPETSSERLNLDSGSRPE